MSTKENKTNKLKKYIDKKFKITERNGTFGGEILGGVVNFLVLTYAMIVIPNILTNGSLGTNLWDALYLATIISIIATTLFVAFGANLPLASAPGIGMSSYLAVLVANGTYTFSQVITITLIAGIIFVFLTFVGFRQKLVQALPVVLKSAIPAAIGLFILNIGLNNNNSKLLTFLINGPTHIVNGEMAYISVLVALFGFLLMVYLHIKNVKGSIFFGIIGATVLHIIIELIVGNNPFLVLQTTSWLPNFSNLVDTTLFKFDFKGAFLGDGSNVFGSVLVAVIIVFSFVLVDLFDTMGTLFGATKNTSLVKPNGEIININRALWVDSLSTVFATFFGLPGCTVYVESATGVKSGARTGLASVITALLFVMALFMAPIIMLIPASATAGALIFVGMLMFSSVMDIDFNDLTQAIPSVGTIITMPLTGNIASGIGVGIILYTITMMFSKSAKKVNFVTYLLTILFIIFFATQNLL